MYLSLPCTVRKNLLILLAHLLTTVAKFLGPGDARAIVADSLLMKQQLLVIHRSRRRAPNLSVLDRLLVAVYQSTSDSAGCGDCLAIDAFEISPSAKVAKVSPVVFIR